MSPVLRVSTHIYGFPTKIEGKSFIFRANIAMSSLKIQYLRKTSPVLRISTHIYGVSKKIDGKTFICSINLGMSPLKSIILEKLALF